MSSNPSLNPRYKLMVASKSPRRHQLIKDLGIPFEVRTKEVDETFPLHLKAAEIPLYLCELKANSFDEEIDNDTIVLTADTIVWVDGQVLNKPENKADAQRMLRMLSGKMHEVYTGVCLKSKQRQFSFYDLTRVYFKQLTETEIDFYIDNYQPFDKAGSYGAQDWIGLVAVEKIEGSYFNVMGLPVHKVYNALQQFS